MATKLVSLAHLDGMPLTAHWVVESIDEQEGLTAAETGDPAREEGGTESADDLTNQNFVAEKIYEPEERAKEQSRNGH